MASLACGYCSRELSRPPGLPPCVFLVPSHTFARRPRPQLRLAAMSPVCSAPFRTVTPTGDPPCSLHGRGSPEERLVLGDNGVPGSSQARHPPARDTQSQVSGRVLPVAGKSSGPRDSRPEQQHGSRRDAPSHGRYGSRPCRVLMAGSLRGGLRPRKPLRTCPKCPPFFRRQGLALSAPPQQLESSLAELLSPGGCVVGHAAGGAGPSELLEAWPRSRVHTRGCFSLGKGRH